MATDDKTWVFDSLVCFLNGPVWNAPLQSFVEEKSLIFEPNVEESVEYKNIYEEFKNLVDFMLCNFMEDIGITPEEFEEACRTGNKGAISVQFEQSLFEQIRAANDYEVFKRMMIHRNVELQLQALELIQRKYGIMPESFVPQSKAKKSVRVESPKQGTSKAVIRTGSLEKEIMEDVVKQFPVREQEGEQEIQYILEEKEILENELKRLDMGDMRIFDNKETVESEPSVQETASFKSHNKPEVDALELKKRQEYLRAQRDKLVALKKEARKKHFIAENLEPIDKKQTRPKSAKAAETALKGGAPEIAPQELRIRKTLAERLKTELVDVKKEEQ